MKYKWTMTVFGENAIEDFNYSAHIVAPIFIEERLNDELDTGEVVLERMPISTKHAFPPKTKIRLTKINAENSTYLDAYDMIVDHDDVQEYPQCPEICTHRISVIEASAVAQGMHVDNIALTYELKDVTLNYKTTEGADLGRTDYTQSLATASVKSRSSDTLSVETDGFVEYKDKAFYRNTYAFWWRDVDNLKGFYETYDGRKARTIEFDPPKLILGVGDGNMFREVLWINYDLTIKKITKQNGNFLSMETVVSRIIGPRNISEAKLYTSTNSVINSTLLDDGNAFYQRTINNYAAAGNRNYLLFLKDGPQLDAPFPVGHTTPTVSDEIWSTPPYPIYQYNSLAGYEKISFNTDQLSTEDMRDGKYFEYVIECKLHKDDRYTPYLYYEATAHQSYEDNMSANPWTKINIVSETSVELAPDIKTETRFVVTATITELTANVFNKAPKKYNAYDLVKKAILSTETKLFEDNIDSIVLPIIYENDVAARLKSTTIYETVYQNKNLWEVLLNVGRYLHSIPYLELGDNGENFILKFKELGKVEKSQKACNKLSVFNSRNLSEYFSQYDAYANNMFSPQNNIYEVVKVKSNDGSAIVSNDNAVILLSKPIMEIIELRMLGVANGEGFDYNITNYVFEQSVYSLLGVSDPAYMSPSKGNSLYYKHNSNVIEGLSYVIPTQNDDALSALKCIYKEVTGITNNEILSSLKYNDLSFVVKYKTQDALRLSVFRPDIVSYLKNSSVERYPHHEQFFGQQDKIIDSERFSLNMFGELMRVGNNVYQRQEYAPVGQEKEAGDLIEIDNVAYYVTETHNEYYPDCVLQKVTYSKDFNQLSQIVTIPSEPRFYEIATQSLIDREIRINDFFELREYSCNPQITYKGVFLSNWDESLKSFITGFEPLYPTYAFTEYYSNQFFPDIDYEDVDRNESLIVHKDTASCVVPVLKYPIKNGLAFEWDMADNFSAGDYISETEITPTNPNSSAYKKLCPVRYVDMLGRAESCDFCLFDSGVLPGVIAHSDFAQNVPQGKVFTDNDYLPNKKTIVSVPDGKKIALLKDNRERLSFNYQINLLYKNDSGFVTYPNLFGDNRTLKDGGTDMSIVVYALNIELNKLSEHISIDDRVDIIAEMDTEIFFSDLSGIVYAPNGVENLEELKSILVCVKVTINDNQYNIYPLFGRNVAHLPNDQKLNKWEIVPVYNQ